MREKMMKIRHCCHLLKAGCRRSPIRREEVFSGMIETGISLRRCGNFNQVMLANPMMKIQIPVFVSLCRSNRPTYQGCNSSRKSMDLYRQLTLCEFNKKHSHFSNSAVENQSPKDTTNHSYCWKKQLLGIFK